MADLVRVRAKGACQISPDGATVHQLEEGDVIDVPADVAMGLKAAGLVEDAEGAEPSAPQPAGEPTVVSPQQASTKTSTEFTPIDEQQAQELAELRAEQAPPRKPDIEPIEHGGDTVDRVLTKGIHGDAVAVEEADTAAQAAKASSAQHVAEEIERAPAAAPDAPEGKMAEPPENKAEPKARRSRKSQSAD